MSLTSACSPQDATGLIYSNETEEQQSSHMCPALYARGEDGNCLVVTYTPNECGIAANEVQNNIGRRISGWEPFKGGLIVQFQDSTKMALWSTRIDCLDPPFDPLTSAEKTVQPDSGDIMPTSVDPEPKPAANGTGSPLDIPPSQAREPWIIALKERQDALGCTPDVVARRTPSLDGNFEYLEVCNVVHSNGILQRRLADGRLKEVIEGSNVKVVRNGPWRGFLLVDLLKYRPEGGSYYPTVVVRPDGKEMLQVPGTEKDGSGTALNAWLDRNGWIAN
ncbi:hypothetical protein [Sphingomonas sp. YL-JM2C]